MNPPVKKDHCEAFLEAPENGEEHLRSCPSCRALAEELSGMDVAGSKGLTLDTLPLAPWEGAGHRSWTTVAVVGAAIAILALSGFVIAGVPPLRGLWHGMIGGMFPTLDPLKLLQAVSNFVRSAPVSFHVFIGIAFVVVNIVFVALLRRPPRGYDAPRG